MIKRTAAVLFFIIVVLSACTGLQQFTRDQSLEAMTKEYAGISEEQAYYAVEKLFRLAAGDDFKIFRFEDKLRARRAWFFYNRGKAIRGTDYWTVRATEDAGKTTVSVEVESGTVSDGKDVYEIFFSRLDYLLDKSDKWLSCDDVYILRTFGKLQGDIDPICNPATITDRRP